MAASLPSVVVTNPYFMKRVVVAEDNLADQELIRLTFEAVDPEYQVVVCSDGEELLKYLQTSDPSDFQFLLLDLNMPRVSGKEVLSRLNSEDRFRTLPVIVFSSSVNGSDIIHCYSQGANAYVRKPVDLNDYQTTIASITEFWGRTNVLARPSGQQF